MKRSTAWLFAAVVGLLLAGLLLSALRLSSAKDRAGRAAEQAGEVERLAAQVSALARRPAVVVTNDQELRQLSGLIERCAEASTIDPRRIETITTQAPRRIGTTPYYRMPTRVDIDGVALPQLVELLSRLTEGGRLQIEDCRFTVPHAEVVGTTWNAEFTLAYLVYDPRQDKTRP